MTQAILDTSVVIALSEDASLVAAIPDECAISVVTLAELHLGVSLTKNAAVRANRLQRLGAIESTFETLPIDAAVARAYSTVASRVLAAGRRPRGRVMDLWIAATALVHRVPIVTRNAKDFDGIPPLVRVQTV